MLVPFITAGGKQETDEAGDGKVKIVYLFWGTSDEGAAVQAVADTYNASPDSIEVEIMSIPP